MTSSSETDLLKDQQLAPAVDTIIGVCYNRGKRVSLRWRSRRDTPLDARGALLAERARTTSAGKRRAAPLRSMPALVQGMLCSEVRAKLSA
jgi:hypothetical protein